MASNGLRIPLSLVELLDDSVIYLQCSKEFIIQQYNEKALHLFSSSTGNLTGLHLVHDLPWAANTKSQITIELEKQETSPRFQAYVLRGPEPFAIHCVISQESQRVILIGHERPHPAFFPGQVTQYNWLKNLSRNTSMAWMCFCLKPDVERNPQPCQQKFLCQSHFDLELWLSYLREEDQELFKREIQSILQERSKEFHCYLVFVTPSGTTVPILFAAWLNYQDHCCSKLMVVCRTAHALEIARNHMIFDIPEGLLIFNHEWRLIECNLAAQRLFKSTKVKLQAKRPQDLFFGPLPWLHEVPSAEQAIWHREFARIKKSSGPVEIQASVFGEFKEPHYVMLVRDMQPWNEVEKRAFFLQNFLQMVLDTIPVRVFWKDRNGAYVGGNKAFFTDAGVDSLDQLAGKTDFDMPWKALAQKLREYDQSIIQRGDGVIDDGVVRELFTTKENTLTVRTFKSTWLDSENNLCGIIGSYEDITPLNQALRESDQNQEKFNQLSENSPAAFWLIDAKSFEFVHINNSLCDLFGYSKQSLLGSSIFNLKEVDHSQFRLFLKNLKEIRDGRKSSLMFESLAKNAQGDSIILQNSIFPIHDNKGIVLRIGGVSTNVTALRKAEDIQREQERLLLQAEKMMSLGAMIAGISHEINNPNNLIMLNASILEDVWIDILPILKKEFNENPSLHLNNIPFSLIQDELLNLLHGVTQGSERIKNITNTLRDYARKDAQDKFEKISIQSIVDGTTLVLSPILRNPPFHFMIVPPSKDYTITGNKMQLEQVIINLITNSIKALKGGKNFIHLSYGVHNEQFVFISVKDSGIGIPKDVLDRIKEPFFTTRNFEGGLGLGLSISMRILKSHGGTLEFESIPNQGTTATIFLPLSSNRS